MDSRWDKFTFNVHEKALKISFNVHEKSLKIIQECYLTYILSNIGLRFLYTYMCVCIRK